MSHSSSRSHGDATNLFPRMFPDSTITISMKLHKDKIRYVMSQHSDLDLFSERNVTSCSTVSFLSISFDESLNDIVTKCRMGILVRYWDEQCDLVKIRYLTSCFFE
ncbi:MAG: hypothetical protein ACEY3H_06260 [Wolbachia sp.]